MKATNNNTDTLFMEIFVELLAIAKTYFQELFKNEKPGVYTLKDVYAYIANCESLETKQGKRCLIILSLLKKAILNAVLI